MDKKNIFLWSLYDFANSIASIVFLLYFSQWLVIDNKVPDIWYNLILVGASILLIITAPIAGSITDKLGIRMPFLTIVTIGLFVSLLFISFMANFIPINSMAVILAAIGYLFANYFYQFQFVFYTPLLASIAPFRVRGFISGLGQAANLSGQITGILITLPLATGAIFLVGNQGRAQTFLPATILFFLLSLPMLLFFKEHTRPNKISINLILEYRNFIKNFIELCKIKGVGRFLLGYFFFNDAIITASSNAPIYLEQVFHISDKVKAMLTLGLLISSVAGALIIGKISDRIGLKKVLLGILVGWVLAFPILGALSNFTYFSIAFIALGLLFGATITITRAVLTYLSPPDSLTHAFSYYTLAERFSTFVGPITWGLITLLLVNTGSLRYRIAFVSMTVFILIGLFIVRGIPAKSQDK